MMPSSHHETPPSGGNPLTLLRRRKRQPRRVLPHAQPKNQPAPIPNSTDSQQNARDFSEVDNSNRTLFSRTYTCIFFVKEYFENSHTHTVYRKWGHRQ